MFNLPFGANLQKAIASSSCVDSVLCGQGGGIYVDGALGTGNFENLFAFLNLLRPGRSIGQRR